MRVRMRAMGAGVSPFGLCQSGIGPETRDLRLDDGACKRQVATVPAQHSHSPSSVYGRVLG